MIAAGLIGLIALAALTVQHAHWRGRLDELADQHAARTRENAATWQHIRDGIAAQRDAAIQRCRDAENALTVALAEIERTAEKPAVVADVLIFPRGPKAGA